MFVMSSDQPLHTKNCGLPIVSKLFRYAASGDGFCFMSRRALIDGRESEHFESAYAPKAKLFNG